jgi:hypothetical protein
MKAVFYLVRDSTSFLLWNEMCKTPSPYADPYQTGFQELGDMSTLRRLGSSTFEIIKVRIYL